MMALHHSCCYTLFLLCINVSLVLGDYWYNSFPSNKLWWAVGSNSEGNTLFATTANEGVYRSVDYQAWQRVSNLPDARYSSVTVDSSGQRVLLTVSGGGLYFSGNRGVDFTSINIPSSWFFGTSNANGSMFYVASLNDSLFASKDGGKSFQRQVVFPTLDSLGFVSVSCDTDCKQIIALTNFQQNVYGGKGMVFISRDYGQTWSNLTSTTLSSSVQGVAANRKLKADLMDLDADLLPSSSVMSLSDVDTSSDIISTMSVPLAAQSSITSLPLLPYFTSAMSSSGQYIFLAAFSYVVYRSDDYGYSWQQMSLPSSQNYYSIACDATCTNVVVVIAEGRCYFSNDSGDNWTLCGVANNRSWRRVASNANATMVLGAVRSTGILIGDVETVYPTFAPTLRPTRPPVFPPTFAPTFNTTPTFIPTLAPTEVAKENGSGNVFGLKEPSYLFLVVFFLVAVIVTIIMRLKLACLRHRRQRERESFFLDTEEFIERMMNVFDENIATVGTRGNPADTFEMVNVTILDSTQEQSVQLGVDEESNAVSVTALPVVSSLPITDIPVVATRASIYRNAGVLYPQATATIASSPNRYNQVPHGLPAMSSQVSINSSSSSGSNSNRSRGDMQEIRLHVSTDGADAALGSDSDDSTSGFSV